jgi:cell wall-associated NlpC family hydrolase
VVSQLLFGWQLEVLEEKGLWAFVRQMDGYLGWAYLPYLRETPAPFPTHLVLAPEMILRKRPALNGNILARLLGGAAVQVSAMKGKWAQVVAHFTGWAPAGQLRSLAELPFTQEARQTMMMKDANSLVGVPYLWGGISSYGIDCSGLAQLLYRWIGIPIPRDADMQYEAGRKVEPPFRPGDLLFYAESGSLSKITHVSISIGGWKIIHSSRSRNGVYYDDVLKDRYLREAFIGACTFPG